MLPYDRGDLVARVHRQGEVLSTAHLPEGTLLHVRVGQGLAAELAPYRAGDRLTSDERVGAGR